MIQSPPTRAAALDAGVRIEWLTLAWMILESLLAIGSGLAAGSVLLIAFGADSVIELLSAAVLLWRLSAEAGRGTLERVEVVERRATWVSAGLLAVLCLYVVATVVLGLVLRVEPETSPAGILVSLGALVIMPVLAHFKGEINRRLDSASLRADIAESITCAYMAGTVLVGLALNAAFGWWWAEYAAAAVLLFWLARETREAFESARGGEQAEG